MLPFILTAALLYGFAPASLAQPGTGSVNALLGAPVQALDGRPLGKLEELIVDVRGGQALYVIVSGEGDARAFPFRALAQEVGGPGLRLDMQLAGELAEQDSPADPRFRRASKLIGQELVRPGAEVIGQIRDIELDMASGEVKRVLATTPEGPFGFPSSVLAQGSFPPLTRWQAEHPGPEVPGERGFVRGKPSRERSSVQGGSVWERE